MTARGDRELVGGSAPIAEPVGEVRARASRTSSRTSIGRWYPWAPSRPGRVAPARRTCQARADGRSSDHAELSTLRSALEESTRRIVAVADRYRDTEDSAIAGDLDSAERGLITARRAVDRALRSLADRV